ncbi:MAG: PIN domain-containing protein [Solirubrobacteraceae bacterium]
MPASTVVVDTNVFTASLKRDSGLRDLYAQQLKGQVAGVAPQTVAEARFGAIDANWGARKMLELRALILAADVLEVDAGLTEMVAQLRYLCKSAGHALHEPLHNGDLWIAAAAIRWGLPLVAHDGIFIGCPRLQLITELN